MNWNTTVLSAAAAVAVMAGSAQADMDWEVIGDFNSDLLVEYDGPSVLMSIDSNFDITNLSGQPLIGVSFTILPNAGETYDPGEFEAIVFDLVADTPEDMSPWVPPSLLNPTPFTVTPSNDSGAGPQTLTFMFADNPLNVGEVLQARFQIEWPTDALFDVLVSPIIPAPAALGLFAVAGAMGRSRRRRA